MLLRSGEIDRYAADLGLAEILDTDGQAEIDEHEARSLLRKIKLPGLMSR